MPVKEKLRHIFVELKAHAPFTLFGALLGIIFMILFKNVGGPGGRTLFAVFHPAHVVLSAMVTASMFKLHALKKRFVLVLIVGYFGSIGIATVSDIIIPHIGSKLLGLDVPVHAQVHHHQETPAESQTNAVPADEGHKIHLAFIEEWYLVNPAAVLGILIAFFIPHTKFPHAGHILISTWASSSYLLMNMEHRMSLVSGIGILVILFVSVWLPCCISDIVFPLLFVKSDLELAAPCPVHGRHSHPHLHKASEPNE